MLTLSAEKTYPASYVFDRSRQNWLDKKHYFTLPARMEIVAVSNWLGGLIRESFLGKYSVHTIYNGIDTSVFRPYPIAATRAKYGWDNDQIILLGVASMWSPRKGLADFIELSKILPENYRIVLIGLNEKQMKNLPANITAFAKTESVQMLAELYSIANVSLNLSYEETMGLTTVEAFACGTPGIVYDKTASPELIKSDDVGFIVPAGNINVLFDVISRVLSQKKESYIKNCRSYALANFRQEDRFQEYVNLYQRLFKENG